MKIFLINPDYMEYGDPPLGLAYLAAYIREKYPSLKIKILDQIPLKKILENILREKPEIIGFTAVSGNYYKVKKLAEEIKAISPKSTLIIGGVHITLSPKSFEKSPFDFGIQGEGEIATAQLISALNKKDKTRLRQINGLLFRENGKIINNGLSEQIKDLDSLPMPARDLLDMKYYSLPRFSSSKDIEPMGSILTSRGCPYNCRFCASSSFWKRKIRFFSAQRVVDEIDLLYKKYHYKKVYIYDDLFSINKQRLKEIINGLEKRKLLGKIEFLIYGRANCFDEETAKLLKKMGVTTITFGFETGSQKMLEYLKRSSVKIEDNIKAIKLSKKYRFDTGGFFMIGSPQETLEDIKQTHDFIKKHCRDNFMVYQTIAFPGTEIWEIALKNKIMDSDFYEHEQKKFVDINPNLLLSESINKKDFEEYFNKINNLKLKKNQSNLVKKILQIRGRHLKAMLSIRFLKKINNLRKDFLKKIA